MNNEGCDIVNKIRANFKKAEITKCREEGCILKLDKLGIFIALKGENLIKDSRFQGLLSELIKSQGDNPKICDCIIFKENGDVIIGLIELKSQKPDASSAKEQLEKGSKVAVEVLEIIIGKYPKFDLFPIILAKSWSRSQSKGIYSEIDVRGKKYDIIHKDCGDSFYEIIEKEKKERERVLLKKQKKRR